MPSMSDTEDHPTCLHPLSCHSKISNSICLRKCIPLYCMGLVAHLQYYVAMRVVFIHSWMHVTRDFLLQVSTSFVILTIAFAIWSLLN